MKSNNPFTLTFGKQPATRINRKLENADEIISTFEADNPVTQAYLISGVRGSGKSALLAEVTKRLEASSKWVVVELNSKQPLLPEFVTRLIDNGMLKMHLLMIIYVGILEHFNLNYSDSDNVGRMNLVLHSLKMNHKKVLVTIDDVSADDEMRTFMSQFQLLVRKGYDIYLLMTGLYENISGVLNDPDFSFLPTRPHIVLNLDDVMQMQEFEDFFFLQRIPKFDLTALDISEIKNKYIRFFDISEEDAEKMANLTMGYPFAFQALGVLYWEYRDSCTFEQIVDKYDRLLVDFVYRAIWNESNDAEKAIIYEMPAEGQKISLIDLYNKVDMEHDEFKKSAERLISRGICHAPEKGYIALSLPRLRAIIGKFEVARQNDDILRREENKGSAD
jgi:hypothetical protein